MLGSSANHSHLFCPLFPTRPNVSLHRAHTDCTAHTEACGAQRPYGLGLRDGVPRSATSTFTQLLSSARPEQRKKALCVRRSTEGSANSVTAMPAYTPLHNTCSERRGHDLASCQLNNKVKARPVVLMRCSHDHSRPILQLSTPSSCPRLVPCYHVCLSKRTTIGP